MSTAHQTEVFIVGGGPVGMFGALLLARRGIRVQIIDSASRPTTHSYACGLHPQTLQLFSEAGIEDEILQLGTAIPSIAFYEGGTRVMELQLNSLLQKHPDMVTLPQSTLEALLETKLKEETGVEVKWMHRLAGVSNAPHEAIAHVNALGETSTGYIIPHWDSVVINGSSVASSFLIGADGHESFVRRALDIPFEQVGLPELYVVYEFESDWDQEPEIRVVLGSFTKSVFWPLGDGRCRWSFQWPEADEPGEFPAKDRMNVWIDAPDTETGTAEHLKTLIEARAPWFDGSIGRIEWAVDVQFERRLASSFGCGRCWLAGDAAHQTCPIGMQSMNMGFREISHLVDSIAGELRGTSAPPLSEYGSTFRTEWEQLMGIGHRLQPLAWSQAQRPRHVKDLNACIPASGQIHIEMLKQLGFELTN